LNRTCTPAPLRRADLHDNPITQFAAWFAAAQDAGQPEPEAMAVATATPGGVPSVRFVLMRGFDQGGLVFFTNRRSRKGEDMAVNPVAAAVFRWATVNRQVRVSGPVGPIDDAESDAYFATRARGSQLGAWASEQSTVIDGRADLERRMAEMDRRFAGMPVPRPPWWGGYRLAPEEVEFWQQGADRLHDRFRYTPREGGRWRVERLSP
jgi:pyridoxamine 5'-phosphate oxidase